MSPAIIIYPLLLGAIGILVCDYREANPDISDRYYYFIIFAGIGLLLSFFIPFPFYAISTL